MPQRDAVEAMRGPLMNGVPTGWRMRLAALGRTRLSIHHALLALLGFVALGALLGMLIAQAGRFTRLTPRSPLLSVDSTLSVSLADQRPLRVHVEVISPEEELRGRAWAAAREALPVGFTLISPLYAVDVRGRGSARLVFAPSVEDAEPYRWDATRHVWQFIPFERDGGQIVIAASQGLVALLRPEAGLPQIISTLEEGQTTGEALALLDRVLVAGALIGPDGTLDVSNLPIAPPSAGPTALVLLRPANDDALRAFLSSGSGRDTLIAEVTGLLDGSPWGGLALDLGPLDQGQAAGFEMLLGSIAGVLERRGKSLMVRVPTPEVTPTGYDTLGYNWALIGTLANALIVAPPGGPDGYIFDGMVDEFLRWATTRVSRAKLHLAFSSLSLDEWGGHFYPIRYDYALAPLGTVGLTVGESGGTLHPQPGQPLTFHLAGQASSFERLAPEGLYRYEVYAADGKHRVWIVTAAALRRRLDWIAAQGLGGVVIDDLLAVGNSPSTGTAVRTFRAGQPFPTEADLVLNWTVRDASGSLIQETLGSLTDPFVWTPEAAGEYTISAELVGEGISQRGAASVRVSSPPLAGSASPTNGSSFLFVPEGMPIPIIPAGLAASGEFELGGQVNHAIHHPTLMHQAGMTWVKFQITWGPGQRADNARSLIEQGHSQGFKVLLSITGGGNYPSSIDFAGYVRFLHDVASYGPDAIEVWNEPNFYFEWPQGQIDGGTYVRKMLAPAYNAIKSADFQIMVISGGLLPTGLYYSEGGCSAQGYGCDDWYYLQQMAQAGAANYMDCVGVHYNAGATPPSATSGHPADPGYQHYSWYFGSMLQLYGGTFGHPVCFTELGYLSSEGYGGLPGNFSWAADTTVAEQAAWLAEAAQLSRQSGQVRLMIVWNVDFTDWGNADPKGGYAILRPDGTCPACIALGNVMP